MAQEKLPAIVARIDERTAHIQEDVKELKSTCSELKTTVGKHGEELASIKATISNSNAPSNHHSFSRKQKAGIWGGVVAFITAIVAAIAEYFRH